jgi:hypothetical protein
MGVFLCLVFVLSYNNGGGNWINRLSTVFTNLSTISGSLSTVIQIYQPSPKNYQLSTNNLTHFSVISSFVIVVYWVKNKNPKLKESILQRFAN